ncbi:MAG: saccharopine dehydrogenase C-terminal domain-containing protein [Ketobacteraceae bacterium]|nr:saccharopine dehydrogenase C-terminal domain-containing protein [Ketobacteraceae bacterium]
MKQHQRRIGIMGAGKIGGAIAKMLASSGDYQVTVLDINETALQPLSQIPHVATRHLTSADTRALSTVLKPLDAVLSACAFDLNVPIAEAALEAGVSYFDLTEDVATTAAIRQLAEQAGPGQIFMPQCGLAPGFVGILAADMARRFDTLEAINMRVGALPLYPDNRLKYNLTWSTEGLVNEYCNPCEAIEQGKPVRLQPLEGLEHLMVDGVEYEAFNTSGGLGTLCESLGDRVTELNYKTLRYPGHRDLMLFLTRDLGLGQPGRRALMKTLLEESVPFTAQDIVVICVTVTGMQQGQFVKVTETRKVHNGEWRGEHWTAIQMATASGVCAVVDLFFEGELPEKGFVKQEQVDLALFLGNRFGFQFNHAQRCAN